MYIYIYICIYMFYLYCWTHMTHRRGSTPVCIDARASLIRQGASFGLNVHQPDFEVQKLPFVVFHKNLGYPKYVFDL